MSATASIRARLLTGLIASLTFVLAVGCVGLYWSQRNMLTAEFDRRLDQDAFAALRLLAPSPGRPLPQTAPAATLPPGLLFIADIDAANGRVERALPADVDLSGVPDLPGGQGPEFRTVTMASGALVRVVCRRMGPPPGEQGPRPPRDPDWQERPLGPRPHDDSRMDPVPGPGPDDRDGPPGGPDRGPRRRAFLAGADLAPLTAALARWVWILLTAGAVGELIVVGVVVLTVRRGLQPLRTLETQIASFDQWGLERRLPTDDLPGEIAPVVAQLNALLERLEEAFDRERAFTASAAHEFRTPLAGIRTRLEVCLRRDRQPQEYQAALGQCLDAAVSLQRMLDALLDLAKLDAGQALPPAETLDVPEMIRAQWSRHEPEALARGCTATIDLPDPLEFPTDAGMLDHIVSNLLSNAAAYADSGSEIRIAVAAPGGRLLLTVSNAASALAADDLPRLFDRFWRKDASRTNTGLHCGLGLAIVSRCVGALNGRVQTNLSAGRLEVTVDLPAATEPPTR